MLNQQDIRQLEAKGITKEALLQQIEQFKKGFPPVDLDRPATAGDGIRVLDERGAREMADQYDRARESYRVTKFVPASGAATRMFKDVYAWRDLLIAGVEPGALLDAHPEAERFFSRISDFAFWKELEATLRDGGKDPDSLLKKGDFVPVIDALLFGDGLGYAFLPKALLAFHAYPGEVRTALEEHLVEGAQTIAGKGDKRVSIHFTLSPEHIPGFREKLLAVQQTYEKRFDVSYDVSFSVQKPSTDTVAVGMDNLPFRQDDGTILFRPGGHGALIENVNDLDHDIVFIKNIDNVVPDRIRQQGILYKKVLGGVLLALKNERDNWLRRIDKGILPGDLYLQAVDFAANALNVDKNLFPDDLHRGCEVLRERLNRPLRVCGMVKNEGEPGGGPFWVRDRDDGSRSLQIVEMSQIDLANKEQSGIVKGATHFNPVDLVCSYRDHHGTKYDLLSYVDKETGFISTKSKDGKDLKALERPGLWNGAMARWNTVFVEVPLITFNPVKTINDLLRDEHKA